MLGDIKHPNAFAHPETAFRSGTPAVDGRFAIIVASDATYSDTFQRHYPVRGREFVLERYELENPTTVWDKHLRRKATVRRTRGDKYPYEDQKCVITLEGHGLEQPRFISLSDFRSVEVSWITGKLVLIEVGIGHVAAVEVIYDTEKDLWVYRESVQYTKKVEPDGPANGSQPLRRKTNRTSSAAGSRR